MKIGLIVEDLVEAQSWLNAVLSESFPGIEIRVAATLAEAYDQFQRQIPDIALVDIGLPDGNGIDLIEFLNTSNHSTLCVITSVFDDDRHIFSALRAGASGYLLKDQKKEDLVKMLKGIVEGEPPLSPAVARRMLGYFAPSEAPAPEVNLTARELDVLALIAKGYTSSRTADLLDISSNTVAGYVKSIYRKLNISSRAEATIEAARRGIISDDLH